MLSDRSEVTFLLGRFMNPNDSRSDVIPGEVDVRQEEGILKTHISGDKADRVCRRSGFDRWHRSEACGFQGEGIWILWDSQESDIEIVQSEMQFITTWVTHGRQMRWLFTAVYTSPHQQEREAFWANIHQFGTIAHQPWLLVGGYNDTINLAARNHGGIKMLRRCDRFKHYIENNGFIDLGFSRHQYTWVRGNNESTQKWPYAMRSGKPVNTQGFAKLPCKPKLFQFQVPWNTHEGFERALQKNSCNKNAIVPALQSLSSALNIWNKEVFGNLFKRKQKLLGAPSRHIKETK
ncbi:hypothetical protein Cgig2_003128 [Carnegiea gigantea]|uniref:Uncharacterized protein n=1 Tax=Carnegiea gigantea TaxID=171969 RepID=A0A9Q1GWV3_9CARY|nr:hypothetical protein Cgig2_003128 [Carnegiea gigantea]